MRFPRWLIPRFSLRALFVIVTILALWLGWQLSIVRQRQALREQLLLEGAYFREAGRGPVGDPLEILLIKLDPNVGPGAFVHTRRGAEYLGHPFREGNPAAGPNWTRRILGDREWELIDLARFGTATDLKRLTCFPEADILARDTPFRSD
jgi:hypothetical protein